MGRRVPAWPCCLGHMARLHGAAAAGHHTRAGCIGVVCTRQAAAVRTMRAPCGGCAKGKGGVQGPPQQYRRRGGQHCRGARWSFARALAARRSRDHKHSTKGTATSRDLSGSPQGRRSGPSTKSSPARTAASVRGRRVFVNVDRHLMNACRRRASAALKTFARRLKTRTLTAIASDRCTPLIARCSLGEQWLAMARSTLVETRRERSTMADPDSIGCGGQVSLLR